jgi:hypothetical protein
MRKLPTRPSGQLATFALTVALLSSAAGCANPSPAAPDPLDGSAAASAGNGAGAASPGTPSATFQLLDGTFRLAGIGGDSITGTYTGLASVARGETSSLELQVTGGTGAFSGATGALSGNGKGAFTGQGPFSATISGRIVAEGSGAFKIRWAIAGTSTVSCAASERISVTQNGTASAPRIGDVATTFQHQLSNTGCTN